MILHLLFVTLPFLPYLTRFCLCQTTELSNWTTTNVRAQSEYTGNTYFQPKWDGIGRWIGPEWWASPLWDWKRIGGGRVRAPAANSRALSLLPFEITGKGTSFKIMVTISFSSASKNIRGVPNVIAAGFGLGRIGRMPDYRSAAVYPRSQFSASINAKGSISLPGVYSSKAKFLSPFLAPVKLVLFGKRKNKLVLLTLVAMQQASQISVSALVPITRITGSFALVTNGGYKTATRKGFTQVTFQHFSMSGSMITRYSGRNFGAIMWSQYTLSKNILRLQSQLAPLDQSVEARLTIRSPSNNKVYQTRTAWSDSLSRTVQFTIYNWNSKQDWLYSVQVKLIGRVHSWTGRIRREPSVYKSFKVGAFSCDEGYLFPQKEMAAHVTKQNPDLLFFAGDQFYESAGGFEAERFAKTELAMLDFLQKWYLFGWSWQKLLGNRPSIIIPDDHDVFQGNLFGDGGRAMKNPRILKWSSGGYIMPGRWVAAVERCNTGHLPKPYADFKTPLGLKPYFTSMTYGGISMAILEDRKFKTAPDSLPVNVRGSGEGGQLLGIKQEKFLAKWVRDWNGTSMKLAFSQTIFCRAATHAGFYLARGNQILDSNAWPLKARNRAVRLMGEGNVLSIHGDQHLGMLLRHGVDVHDDANVAFMVPGTANGFPRAWWPGIRTNEKPWKKKFTGRFKDDAGHPITVLAVGNPEPYSHLLEQGLVPSMQYGRAKGSGYGMVVLNRLLKTATFHLYRVGRNFDEFKGFPKKVFIGGKPEGKEKRINN